MRYDNYIKAILGLFSMVFSIYIGSSIFKSYKLDLTEEKIYSLSKGSKELLKKINFPIHLKLFYSKKATRQGSEGLRLFNNHFLYVRELLKEFVENSNNQISLEIIDPRPDTEEEEDALSYGLKKFQLSESEKYFFGMVATSTSGGEKIIEFFNPYEKDKVEYNLSKLIYSMMDSRKKTIGILSGIPVAKDQMNPYMAQIMQMQGKPVIQPWIITNLLKENYKIIDIDTKTADLKGLDALIIIHPKNFSRETLYEVDQFLLKGGKILLLVDPMAVSDKKNAGEESFSPDENFSSFIKNWGISIKKDIYVGDKYLAGVGRFSPSSPTMRILPLVNCDHRCNQTFKDILTFRLDNIQMILPGYIEIIENENLTYSPILSTTAKGNTYYAKEKEFQNTKLLLKRFKEGSRPINLAYKIHGEFDSYFAEGINNKKHIKASLKKGLVIVIADVDFISDQLAFERNFLGVSEKNDNYSFFTNSVESLLGDLSLLSIRSKGLKDRSFKLINEIEIESEKKTYSKVDQIQKNIARYKQEMERVEPDKKSSSILNDDQLKKKKKLIKKIAKLKLELREVKREGREKIENLGKKLQAINTLVIPFIVILIGFFLYYKRKMHYEREGI